MPPSRLELLTGYRVGACAMSASPFRSDHTWYAQYMARERAARSSRHDHQCTCDIEGAWKLVAGG